MQALKQSLRQQKHKLYLVAIVTPVKGPMLTSPQMSKFRGKVRDVRVKLAKERLAELAMAASTKGIEAETLVVESDDVASSLVKTAEELKVDAIFAGRKGESNAAV